MTALAPLLLVVALWLTAPTFGADHAAIAELARVALAWLVTVDTVRQQSAVPARATGRRTQQP